MALCLGMLALIVRNLREAREERRSNRRWWFERRLKDRADLLEAAKRTGFRAQLPNETTWDYAQDYDRWATLQLGFSPEWQTSKWDPPVELERKPMPIVPKFPSISGILRDAFKEGFQAMRESTKHAYPPGRSEHHFQLTIKTYWWSATDESGIVHKGAMLRHDQIQTPVFACDLDTPIHEAQLEEHETGAGPLVTCLWCANGQRRR